MTEKLIDARGIEFSQGIETIEEFNALKAQAERADTLSKLANIDTKSARPLRAIAAGTATQADYDTLAALEQGAAGLRAQL